MTEVAEQEPQIVMRCPACRFGWVRNHITHLECERCGATGPVTDKDKR